MTPAEGKSRRVGRWVALGAAGAALLVILAPGPRAVLGEALARLVAMDVAGLERLLRRHRSTAWIVSSLLMILQSLAAPIPAVPITLANAMIYGPWLGSLLSLGSAQAAAVLCFLLARRLGRPFVERLTPGRALDRFDRFFARHGVTTVLVARLVPVVSFDAVSYAAGLTPLRLAPFFVATALGQLPATLVYSFAGAQLLHAPSRALLAVLWFLAAVALGASVVWARARARRSPP